MDAEPHPENENTGPRLKLRGRVWRTLLFLVALSGLHGCIWFLWHFSIGFGLPLAPLIILFFVIRERRVHSPVLRFWDDGSAYALRVRRANTGVVLYESEQATLAHADLRAVDFSGSYLQDVNASEADLRGADLRGADLSGADLSSADLRGAALRRTRLHSTRLVGADLREADLCSADFQRRDLLRSHSPDYLRDADFRGAVYSTATRWPHGFDPASRGCVLRDDEHANLPIPIKAEPTSTLQLPIASTTDTLWSDEHEVRS